jgi:hypothetical protein
MIPIFPPEQIIAIEALWSKKVLQEMAIEYFLEPGGDKEGLVTKLIWVGALDKDGTATGIPVQDLLLKKKRGARYKEFVTKEPRQFKLALKTVPYTVPLVGPKFDMGQIVMTRGVNDQVATDAVFAKFVMSSLRRHANADWGEMSAEDKKENDYSLDKRLRLFSAYERKGVPKIWIITEADRSATTILFPEEY